MKNQAIAPKTFESFHVIRADYFYLDADEPKEQKSIETFERPIGGIYVSKVTKGRSSKECYPSELIKRYDTLELAREDVEALYKIHLFGRFRIEHIERYV